MRPTAARPTRVTSARCSAIAFERSVRENVPYSISVTSPKMPSASIDLDQREAARRASSSSHVVGERDVVARLALARKTRTRTSRTSGPASAAPRAPSAVRDSGRVVELEVAVGDAEIGEGPARPRP
jgi:hypothetical protein